MRKTTTTMVAAVTTLGLAASAFAATGHHHLRAAQTGASRLDDGKQFLAQAKISEQQAIAAAQTAASGALNEVDLEHLGGRLVFNVDVGVKDVKVDATTGRVVAVDEDD